MIDDLTHDMAHEVTGDGMRAVSGDGSAPAPRRPARVVPALADRGPGLDAPPDPTPVNFTQQVDDAWHFWSVVEVDAREVPGTHGARCLVFARRDCIRRVWDYPADWRALDDAGLAALSWHR